MNLLMTFILLSLSVVSFAKGPSSSKYDWKKDLVDVEYHRSDFYVKEPGLYGQVTYAPVYKSWTEWTTFLRNLVKTPTYRKSKDDFEYGMTFEEYNPYQELHKELSSFSIYLSEVRKLCGRYPTKDELVELSQGPVHSLKCPAIPKINGKELHEQKHWAEALSDPELRVFSHKDSKREYFHVVLRLPPLIQSDRNSDYVYAPSLDDTYVFNASFSEAIIGTPFSPWDTLLNYLRGCGHEFYLSMLDKMIKDSKGFCYYKGEVIYPFEKLFKVKDVYLKKNKTLHFEHLVEGSAPHIYFRNFFNKKHGDPKMKKVKKK